MTSQVVTGWTVVDLGAGRSVASALRLLLLLLRLMLVIAVLLLLVDAMDGVAFLFVAVPLLRHSAQFQSHSLDFGLGMDQTRITYPMKKKTSVSDQNKQDNEDGKEMIIF